MEAKAAKADRVGVICSSRASLACVCVLCVCVCVVCVCVCGCLRAHVCI